MKKIIITLIVSLVSTVSLKAQDMIFSLDYNFGYTTGDFEKFIQDEAYRGGGLNYTKFLEANENLGVSFSIDWQGFYQKMPRESFPYYAGSSTSSNTDINAVQFHYMYTAPILLGLDYYFFKDQPFLPYIGINAGMIYTEQELYISAFDNEINTAWDFAYGAEAGVHLVFGESGLGMNLLAKYNLSTYEHKFQSTQFETKYGSYFSVGLGLSFIMLNYY